MQDIFQLSPQYDLPWYMWALALLAVVIVGMAKAGIKGVGVIVVTILAFVFESKASTGILLPLLTIGDIFAVIYYNRHAQWKYLIRLLPWVLLGVLIGVWVGNDMSEVVFKYTMAAIILFSVFMMYIMDRQKRWQVPDNWIFAGIMGFGAGFTTMIGNLAGPFANLFFLAVRLPKDQFIGTAAWLFFIVNLFKLPFHIFVWNTISAESIAVNLRLFPGVIFGLVIGIYLVKIIREQSFRQMILILTALGALMILVK